MLEQVKEASEIFASILTGLLAGYHLVKAIIRDFKKKNQK